MTNITIITEIQTKPRPRFVNRGKFVQAYTPKTALTYERYIASEYQRLGGKYFEDKPLVAALVFYFKAPSDTPNWKKWAIEQGYDLPCTKHKDLDNLAKSVLDALNTVAYQDDKQITYLTCSKCWTTGQEKIEIWLTVPNRVSEEELKNKYKDSKKNEKTKTN